MLWASFMDPTWWTPNCVHDARPIACFWPALWVWLPPVVVAGFFPGSTEYCVGFRKLPVISVVLVAVATIPKPVGVSRKDPVGCAEPEAGCPGCWPPVFGVL